MEGSLVVAIGSAVISLVSGLIAWHYKRLGERDQNVKESFVQTLQPIAGKVKELEQVVSKVADTVNKVQQDVEVMKRDLDNVEKDTRRLEGSLEKEVKQVSEKVDEIYKMIFTLVQRRVNE